VPAGTAPPVRPWSPPETRLGGQFRGLCATKLSAAPSLAAPRARRDAAAGRALRYQLTGSGLPSS